MLQRLAPLYDYSDDIQAERDAETLEAHGIPCVVRHEHETFNPAFTLRASLNAVHLLVPEDAVDEARGVLGASAEAGIDPSLETMLAGWPDTELIDVAARPDEWHPATVAAAERVLERRGVLFTRETRDENDHRRVAQVRRPVRGDPGWLAIGFALALAGGLGGILMGLGYLRLTERDPHGEPYPVYDPPTRRMGRWMMLVGLVSAAVWLGVSRLV
jgi:hypothetical protein